MGSDQSSLQDNQATRLNSNRELPANLTSRDNNNQCFIGKHGTLHDYNWIPSFDSLILKPNKTNRLTHPLSSQDTKEIVENPKYVDLRRNMPSMPSSDVPYSQVIKSIVTLINYQLLISKKLNTFPPSYLYLLYLLEKVIGTTQLHSFRHVSDIIKQFGICAETDYQTYPEGPSDETYQIASPYRHLRFILLANDISLIKQYLAKECALLIGFPIYSNFLKTETNPKLTISNPDDILLGGGCGLIVGYQESDEHLIIQTTKGKRWGDRGIIFMPYQELLNKGGEIIDIEIRDELILLDIEKYQNNNNFNNFNNHYLNNNNNNNNNLDNVNGNDNNNVSTPLQTIF